jgi:hypothetical protein
LWGRVEDLLYYTVQYSTGRVTVPVFIFILQADITRSTQMKLEIAGRVEDRLPRSNSKKGKFPLCCRNYKGG